MELRCIHRHTSKTHPNCFKQGLIIEPNWWEGKKIAYFDIETAVSLHADRGFMLSWCLKNENDKVVKYDIIRKEELFNLEFDKRIVKSAIQEIENNDIIVTYYGKGFDAPYLRTRAIYWDLPFPEYGTVMHWDLYYQVKRLLKVSRRSLDNVTNLFGISGKTHIDWFVWLNAQYGDKKALKSVLEHNKQDVIILEKLHKRLGGFAKWSKASI